MTKLVALLSSGKGSWTHVQQLIASEPWEHIYLITNDFGKENFSPNPNTSLLVINTQQSPIALRDSMIQALRGKLDGDVAVNFISGNGDEHMALLSALLRLGSGIRLVIKGERGMEEL